MRKSLSFALLLMGFNSLVIQVLLLRELLVSFYGNELTIGIILGNWLIIEALGSFGLGRTAERLKKPVLVFAFLSVIIACYLPFAVYYSRIIKTFIQITPGEALGLVPVLYLSFIILAPIGLCDGAQFTYGSRILASLARKNAPVISNVYIYEALGSILGGLVVTYIFIPYFTTFQIAFIMGFLNLLSALLIFYLFTDQVPGLETVSRAFSVPRLLLVSITGVLLFLAGYLLLSPRSHTYHKLSLKKQWKNYEVIHHQHLITTPVPDIQALEDLAHFSLLALDDPAHILVLGGGTGGLLHEILKHPVERVDYVELDPLLIALVLKYGVLRTREELADERVHVHFTDGRFFLTHAKEKYDAILVNLPPPYTLQLNRFYSLEFFAQAARHLTDHGVLVLTLPGSDSYLEGNLRDLNNCIITTLKTVFKTVQYVPGETNIILASPDKQFSFVPQRLIERFADRDLETSLFCEPYIDYRLQTKKLGFFQQQVGQAGHTVVNRDFTPAALLYALSYWNTLYSSLKVRSLFNALKQVSLPGILLVLAGLFAVMSLGYLFRPSWRSSSLPLAVWGTGFTGMGFEIILIMAFQSLYGYMYYQLGLLLTAFMTGLLAGAFISRWLTERLRKDVMLLIKTEGLILVFTLVTAYLLYLLQMLVASRILVEGARYYIMALSVVAGGLVGAEFPVAVAIHLNKGKKVSHSAGTLYAADLAGGWVGSLAVSIILIPVLGLYSTLVVIGVLKTTSLLLLVISRRYWV
jgi:spermidine synthase